MPSTSAPSPSRAELGEADFDAAVRAGRALGLDQAADDLLHTLDALPASPSGAAE